MADRKDYFFRQKVTEAELDAGFDGLEQGDFNIAIDHGLVGIVAGMGVAEKSGTPDLTVDVAGPGQAYSKQGERISFSSLQNVDLSIDDGSVSTAVGTPGNARIVSLFITFDRLLSDPRIDGNSLTVFHLRDESFAFSVVAGAEATSGSEVPPALDPNKILLADVTLIFGQTQIFNADIDVAVPSRREVAFAFAGSTPVSLSEGTAEAAVGAILTALNNHLTAAANQHPANEVLFTPGTTTWAGALAALAGTTEVDGAIDAIVSELASIAATSGGDRVGVRATTSLWHDATGLAASSARTMLDAIVNVLGSTAVALGGSDKIGQQAIAGSPESITLGSVRDAIVELLGFVNARLLLTGGTLSGNLTINGGDLVTDGHLDFDPTPEDPGVTDPSPNRIYAKNTVQAWVVFNVDGIGGLTIIDRYNVSTVVLDGAAPDRVDINLFNAMLNTNFAVMVDNVGGTSDLVREVRGSRTTSHLEILMYDDAGVLQGLEANAAEISVVVIGQQA